MYYKTTCCRYEVKYIVIYRVLLLYTRVSSIMTSGKEYYNHAKHNKYNKPIFHDVIISKNAHVCHMLLYQRRRGGVRVHH